MRLTKKKNLISIVVILCFLATAIVMFGSIGMSFAEAESLEANIPAISEYTTYEIVNYQSKIDVENCTTDGLIIDFRKQTSWLAMVRVFTIPANVNHVIIYGYGVGGSIPASSSFMFTNEERDDRTLYFTVENLICSGNPNVFKALSCEYDITFKGNNSIASFAFSGFGEYEAIDNCAICVRGTITIRTAKGSNTKILGRNGIDGEDGKDGANGANGQDGVNTSDATKHGSNGVNGEDGQDGGFALTIGGIGIFAI